MTSFEWFEAGQALFMAWAAFYVWSLRRGFQIGKWSQQVDRGPEIEAVKASLGEFKSEVTTRFDRASAKMSDLSSDVQSLPERMRKDFMPREELALNFAEGARDRGRIWDEIKEIWKVVREQREQRRQR